MKEKHVLITGGSSGIGFEIAKKYFAQGLKVTLLARDSSKLETAKQLICNGRDDARVLTISCDVGAGEKEVTNAVQQAAKVHGNVDILINSAGITYISSFVDSNVTEFENVMRVNYLGSVYATRAVLPGMIENGEGNIVYVSSQVAQAAIHGFTAYAASKWALRGLAEALQMEVRPFGVTISVSYPPDTDTPMYKEEMKTKPMITKVLSDSSAVMNPATVADEIVNGANAGLFSISHGVEGWALKQLHPGMTPINNVWELLEQIWLSSVLRFTTTFLHLFWEYLIAKHSSFEALAADHEKKSKKTS